MTKTREGLIADVVITATQYVAAKEAGQPESAILYRQLACAVSNLGFGDYDEMEVELVPLDYYVKKYAPA